MTISKNNWAIAYPISNIAYVAAVEQLVADDNPTLTQIELDEKTKLVLKEATIFNNANKVIRWR